MTQRGNHRDRVFFSDGDPEAYLSLLHAFARRHELAVIAYCLMPNHVHLVVVPNRKDSIERTLRAVHGQYAQRANRMRQTSGHLWQGRFHASALDDRHFLNAIRYVELNPVRAGLVAKAIDYAWSSAAAHSGLRADPLLEPLDRSHVLRGILNWAAWLDEGVPDDCRSALQSRERRNLPCGSDEFVAALEKSAGRSLGFRKRGGQPKQQTS